MFHQFFQNFVWYTLIIFTPFSASSSQIKIPLLFTHIILCLVDFCINSSRAIIIDKIFLDVWHSIGVWQNYQGMHSWKQNWLSFSKHLQIFSSSRRGGTLWSPPLYILVWHELAQDACKPSQSLRAQISL